MEKDPLRESTPNNTNEQFHSVEGTLKQKREIHHHNTVSPEKQLKAYLKEREQILDARKRITQMYEDMGGQKGQGQLSVESMLPEVLSKANESLPDIEKKIAELKRKKSEKNEEKKSWLKRAAVVGGFLLGGLFASQKAQGQEKDSVDTKAKIENITQSREKQKEDFMKYADYLKEKNDTSAVTPDDMDTFLDKFFKAGDLDTAQENHKREILKAIYEKHSPYSLDGRKIALPNLAPGYDLEFGDDKEERILLNKILTTVDFLMDKEPELSYEDIPVYGKVISRCDIEFTKTVGNKTIKGSFDYGSMKMLLVQIVDNTSNEVVAETVISTSNPEQKTEKIDNSKFLMEFNTLISHN